MHTITTVILSLTVGMLIPSVIEHIDTRKRLKISQREWEEYSKGKTLEWKREHIVDFLMENRIRHGWPYIYIPKWW